MQVLADNMSNNQGYEARGIVARIKEVGKVEYGGLQLPVYQYVTLDTGKGNEPVVCRLKGKAPFIKDELTGETELDFSKLNEGDFIIQPALIYEKIEWSTKLRNEHMLALATYKPKDIVSAYRGEVEDPTKFDDIVIAGDNSQDALEAKKDHMERLGKENQQ